MDLRKTGSESRVGFRRIAGSESRVGFRQIAGSGSRVGFRQIAWPAETLGEFRYLKSSRFESATIARSLFAKTICGGAIGCTRELTGKGITLTP